MKLFDSQLNLPLEKQKPNLDGHGKKHKKSYNNNEKNFRQSGMGSQVAIGVDAKLNGSFQQIKSP